MASITLDRTINGVIATKICKGCCPVVQEKHQPSGELLSCKTIKFFEFIYSNLGEPLFAIQLEKKYYISFLDDVTGCYDIKSI